MNQQNHTQH